MNTGWLLLLLLLVSFTGSMLVQGRGLRGMGLPSGAEYLVLGFIAGPHVLGVASSEALEGLRSLALAAVGWLALLVGLRYGTFGGRRVSTANALVGIAFAIVTAGTVGGLVGMLGLFLLPQPVDRNDLIVLSLGSATALCESTRHAVRWVIERYGAKGRLADLFADIASADDLVPLLLLTFLVLPHSATIDPLGVFGRMGLPPLLGLLLGLLLALLIAREQRRNESWGLVLGVSLLGIGVAVWVDASAVTTAFFAGLMLSRVSRHAAEIRAMTDVTEQPVIQPVLLMAGAWLTLEPRVDFAVLVVGAIVARFLARTLLGGALLATRSGASAWMGFGTALGSSGALSVGIALTIAIAHPGRIGNLVLVMAVVATITGELFAPQAMHRALQRAGELEATTLPDQTGAA